MSILSDLGRDIANYFGVRTGTDHATEPDQHEESLLGNTVRVAVVLGIAFLPARAFGLSYFTIVVLVILLGAAWGLLGRLARRRRPEVSAPPKDL